MTSLLKCIPLILILFPLRTFGQTLTGPEIKKYVTGISTFKGANKLLRVDYPNMSGCGGGIHGYYNERELVLIESVYKAELGFSSRTIYFKENVPVYIVYHEHVAEWGKYEEKYPPETNKWDPDKRSPPHLPIFSSPSLSSTAILPSPYI